MNRDLYHNAKAQRAVPITTISADGTTTGDIIDLQDYGSAMFAILSGTLTTGTFTPKLTAGDAANLSDGVEVTAAAELLGTIAGATFAIADDGVVKKIGYRGDKRYIRLDIVGASTAAGVISAVAILGHPHAAPVA